ncbi:ATP-dependent DNA helicase pif1-like [Rhodnius prolixus]|uniref:ATP-dependent DNA helicase pif1-like n=1 Tax=Rhodnius prolixus TaxID=13249 RepID=UPI003D18FAEB
MLAEAALNCTGTQIRLLFAIVLTTCFPARAQMLWDNHKDSMTDDILYRHRTRCNDLTISFSEAMYNEALIAIEDLCIAIANLPISHFGMGSPNRSASDLLNTDMNRELQYDTVQMASIVSRNVPLLNDEQKIIYDRIMLAVSAGQGGFFFLDAPGGTGKTFLISLLLAEIRSKNGIALAVASSGIAATLLDGGRTAHSAFKLPLNIKNNPDAVCNIKKQSSMATVLKQCKIIIWDECTMAHKHSLEALDRTLKDIKNNDKLFGGTLLLLSGDFRQTLPVIPRSTYADEINACLKSSRLWRNVEKVQLTVNMRVQMLQDPSAETFSKPLLDIGDGKVAVHENTGCIKLQTDFCTIIDSQNSLIDHIFPDEHTQYANHKWLAERAILAAKNVDVNGLNLKIQQLLPGDLVSYKSIDAVCDTNETVNYPIEFLNSLDLPGMPPHHLQLKVGSPIILLRNLNPPRLCNGTRLVIKKLMKNVIEAIILNGKFQGENVLLPRIPMIPTDVPIEFKRTQFTIRLAFAMTINKSQGQTLSVCGLDLETPCFSHGQLYVRCSRVGKPSSLFVLAKDGLTKNIVHSIALRD